MSHDIADATPLKTRAIADQRKRPYRSFTLPFPPLELTQQFAEQIAELEAIKVRARAFAGELSSAA